MAFSLALAPSTDLYATVVPTNTSIFVFDSQGLTTFQGAPAPIGAVIDAYDPGGVHCGTAIVGDGGLPAGSFAAMAVYGDAPGAPDEGASWGDTVTFRINDVPAQVVRNGPVIWNGNGSVYDISLDVPYVGLEFSTQPAGSVSGQPLATPPVVRAINGGTVDESFTDVLTVSLASGAGSLSGALTATASAGVATFGNIIYTATADGESFSLQVDDQAGVGDDLAPVASEALAADAVATQLVFSTQPAGAVNGMPMSTQPVLEARDAASLRDVDFAETVTLTAAAITGGGALSGDVDVVAVSGVATFATVQYDVTTGGDTFALTGNDEDGVGSDLPSVESQSVVGQIRQLVFQQQPGGSVSGLPLSVQPVVIADLGGADPTYAGTITLSLEAGAGTLSGSLTAQAVAGVATFANVAYTAAVDGEPFALRAVDAGGTFAAVVSDPASSDVVATQLAFATQPAGSISGIALATQPLVAATDAASTLDADFADLVELSLASGSGSLAGSLSGTASGGMASFADVAYVASADWEPFSLQAVGGGLTGVSAALTSDVQATRLVFATQPAGAVSGTPMSTQPVVEALDAASLRDLDFTEIVTLTGAAVTGGGSLAGDVEVAAVAGLAAFATVQYDVDSDGDTFALVANDEDGAATDLSPATSATTTGRTRRLVFQAQPGGSVSGHPLASPLVIRAEADGVDPTYTGNVTLSLDSGPGALSGTLTVQAVAGVATFPDVAYTAIADGETFSLRAADGDGTFADAVSSSAAADVVATHLAFTTVPAGSVSGLPLTVQPVVAAMDDDSTTDTDINGSFTLSETFGSGELFGNLSQTASAGVAAWTDVGYAATADNQAFRLAVQFDALAPDQVFLTSDVLATHLVFATQPGGAVNGIPMLTQPVVEALDGSSVRDTDFGETVTLTRTAVSGGGALSGDVDVVAVAGVATFATVQYDVISDGDAFTLTADDEDNVDTDLLSSTSGIVTGDIRRLVFQAQPGGSVSGLPLTMPLVVEAQAGGLDPTYAGIVTLSLESGPGTLSGTLAVPAVAGVARFTDVVYTATEDGEDFSLRAVDQGGDFPPAVSSLATSDVVATRLAFTTEPDGSVSGVALTEQPAVAAVDARSAIDTDFAGTIALSLASGQGSLSGSLMQTAADGVATWTDVGYSATADNQAFLLRAASTGLAGDLAGLVRSDVVATKLVFTRQPGRAVNGLPMLTQPQVEARDSASLRDVDFTETITLTRVAVTGGGILSGSVDVAAAAGVATFTTVQYAVTSDGDAFALIANDEDGVGTDLPSSTSSTVTGRIRRLVFQSHPGGSVSGLPLMEPLVVRAEAGEVDPTYTGRVTVSLESGPGTLSGTLTVPAVAGVARFGNVAYTATEDSEAFALRATDDGGSFADAVSRSTTSDVRATGLAFTAQPGESVSGVPLTTQPVVAAVDANSTIDSDFAGPIDLLLASGGGTLSGALSLPAPDGVASFTDVTYAAAADREQFSLRAAAGALTGASAHLSSDVRATQLVFTTHPGGATNGVPMVTQPVVEARDGALLTDIDFVETVTLTGVAVTGSGRLSGDVDVAAVAGVATFGTVQYDVDSHGDQFGLVANDDDEVGDDLPTSTSDAISGSMGRLVFQEQPGGSVSGLPMEIQPIVVADLDGIDPSYTGSVTLALQSGSGTLAGTLTAQAISGSARFTDVVYTAAADSEVFSLRAVDDGGVFAAAVSDSAISDVVATQLVFTSQPRGAANGVPMLTQPVVEAWDGASLRDVDFAETVTLRGVAVTGSGALSGDVDIAAVAGVATFATVQYDVDSNGDRFALTADDEAGVGSDLPTSTSETSAGSMGRLLFEEQPEGSVSGLPLAVQPVVIADLGGLDATYDGTVTLTLESGEGSLSGSLAVPAVAGVARFSDVVYTATIDGEAYALRASDGDGGFADAISASVISDARATRLVFSSLPDTCRSGAPLAPPPEVTAQDPGGLTDADYTEVVTLRLDDGLGSLSGTLSETSIDGVAAFPDVVYTAAEISESFVLLADDEPATGDTDLAPATSRQLVSVGLLRVEIPLAAGFNLVSWSVDVANDSIAAIAAPLAGNLIQALGFDTSRLNPNAPGTGAKLYDPALPPSVNTLKLTDHRQGYWLKMGAPDVLVIVGSEVDVHSPIPLTAGYNLVPFLPASRDLIRHSVGSILPSLEQVLGFETPAHNPNSPGAGAKLFSPALPPSVNTLKIMAPNLGYWVKLATMDELAYLPEADPSTPSETPGTPVDGRAHPTNRWMGLYGRLTVRGDPAPPGTVVDVVDAAGTVAAWTETQHSGSYGYLPVYLDDPVSERDEGAEIGEWLDVRVDGQYTGYRIQWLEFGDLVELDLWLDPPTAVSPTGRPQVFSLQQNYPNPFNAGTTIGYQLAEEATVRLSIYGLNGQVVRRLVRQLQRPGEHSAVWDGRDDAEIPVTSGCYLYRLRAGTFEQTRKLLLLK